MDVSYGSVAELAAALRRAARALAEHEKKTGHDDPDWPGWFARHMWAEQDQPHSERFAHLPERVDPKEMVTSHPVEPPRDPQGGQDTERDFLLRYGAGGDDLWDVGDV